MTISRDKKQEINNFKKSQELKQKSHRLIPGGAHTYAKGDDQYPELAPGFVARGKGCHVWDVDDNKYIEYGMGLRAVTLGHGYEPVVEAAYKQMLQGLNFNRPAAIEVECAEMFLDLIEGGEMVKFAKNGSDATTAAIKLARAYTGRDLVANCVDHPFFSTDDWFIGASAMNAGIPQAIQDLSLKFNYNDIESVKELFDRHPHQIACLIMEAERMTLPKNNFLHEVKRICHENGALFILDEIITGFRWHLNGAQKLHNIVPDLSTFGKAMGNGFAIAALTGKREIMELGGLDHDRERVFLLSTTFGAETSCLAAAMAVMKIYQTENVVEHLYRQGGKLIKGINQAIADRDLAGYFGVEGKACNLIYVTKDSNKKRSQPFRTLFLQEIIKRGIIAPSLVVSFAHQDNDIQQTVDAIGDALNVYRRALDEGVEKYLVGRSVKPVFRRYN
ncbi:glutamate-1-semialdehyde 2,1-aminomutase [Waterburya agarophytonicola K14]|uniref:Glutamate-1-semialdehyde 2,1-aminomutase n=1 Tax=Waterburya agarophytonicola KI4 TaxID=2874699 RepID=A0A964BQP3_9CYAN|nr:glutamate-1-semialdehyde 2,1-aminomutase [Waterburya agarophytonicola]MCC0176768.1 glutamate-1-semialdehyde 2,1-aminomutase [Waterburya agarophytonicola KI4]